MDDDDYRYIQRGIEMNLCISKEGQQLGKVSHYISDLVNHEYRDEDVFSSCEVMTTAAADARMAGINLPVMSSGGSGNQGIVAILVPHYVGQRYDIPDKTIITSIGVSHMVNSYIKCFTGDLSPLCGCAIAAGVGAAVALVYQRAGRDIDKITLAVNNLVSDLGGMLCDGAKAGCALKVGTSTNSAIRSAQMALHNHGITQAEGFVGATAEQTIQNLSRIGDLGMALADDTMLDIMMNKASRRLDVEKKIHYHPLQNHANKPYGIAPVQSPYTRHCGFTKDKAIQMAYERVRVIPTHAADRAIYNTTIDYIFLTQTT